MSAFDEKVRFVLPCPNCGGDAQWTGTVVAQGGGTSYVIICPACPQERSEDER